MCFFLLIVCFFFFFKQKTAYEMRISDWSSDVCSSDLLRTMQVRPKATAGVSSHRRDLGSLWLLEAPRTCPDLHPLTPGAPPLDGLQSSRSEERRVGKECVSTCRSRWSPYH